MQMASIRRSEIADRQLLQLVQRRRHVRQYPASVGPRRINQDRAHFVLSGKVREITDSTAFDAPPVSGGCLPLFADRKQKACRNFELPIVSGLQPSVEVTLLD